MNPYTKRVVEMIKSIPPGYVMTYGQVAELAGNRRGARQVVRILHTLSHVHQLPWHRVINAKGEIAIQDDTARLFQSASLQAEGVEVTLEGKVDLMKYRYMPDFMGEEADWM
ncbi:MGMT family protein [Paenibacillus rigui]|uniref:DNA methyltransferase n=1 Tax=Paenibacillus rigui TaxID=554312 RepID=A0A229UHP7_9BACL|nr:MGMT family protein [Paenibacillus rigui]OXM82934.1 DNA methyltransferase [Paenibacillus rigui]